MSTFTGHLIGASRENVDGGYVVVGTIYGDARRRYADGTIIHTSLVMREERSGHVIRTRSSVYQVDSWRT
jgi:hypothetical protein